MEQMHFLCFQNFNNGPKNKSTMKQRCQQGEGPTGPWGPHPHTWAMPRRRPKDWQDPGHQRVLPGTGEHGGPYRTGQPLACELWPTAVSAVPLIWDSTGSLNFDLDSFPPSCTAQAPRAQRAAMVSWPHREQRPRKGQLDKVCPPCPSSKTEIPGNPLLRANRGSGPLARPAAGRPSAHPTQRPSCAPPRPLCAPHIHCHQRKQPSP